MKRNATTREAQHSFASILAAVERGDEVIITKRGKQVARIQKIASEPIEWPDFAARMKRIFGGDASTKKGQPVSALIISDRNERI